jgi:hypothetical protein
VRFSVFQSFCISVRPLRSIGFLRSHRALAVSDGCRGLFSPDNVRRLVTQAVSSSHKLAASSKRFHLSPAPNIADTQAGSTLVHLPWGLRVLFTTSVSRIVAAPGLPTPDTFRPWCSSHLRRFDPRPTLRVYFTPQPLPGFTLQGISLLHSHNDSSSLLCLHAGCPTLAKGSYPPSPRTHSPTSRLCSMQESVVKMPGFSRHLARSLLEFSVLQVLLSLLAPTMHCLPLSAL